MTSKEWSSEITARTLKPQILKPKIDLSISSLSHSFQNWSRLLQWNDHKIDYTLIKVSLLILTKAIPTVILHWFLHKHFINNEDIVVSEMELFSNNSFATLIASTSQHFQMSTFSINSKKEKGTAVTAWHGSISK